MRFPGYKPTKAYFDWLWGGGMDGVVRAMKSNLSISLENLEVRRAGGTTQVFDKSTGYYFLHDFVFSSDALSDLTLAHSEMLEQAEGFLAKYRHLGDKTRRLLHASDGVCFVYHGVLSEAQADEFFATVQAMFGGSPTLLNVVQSRDALPAAKFAGNARKLIVRAVDDEAVKGTPEEWKGSDASWDKVFEDFVLRGGEQSALVS